MLVLGGAPCRAAASSGTLQKSSGTKATARDQQHQICVLPEESRRRGCRDILAAAGTDFLGEEQEVDERTPALWANSSGVIMFIVVFNKVEEPSASAMPMSSTV